MLNQRFLLWGNVKADGRGVGSGEHWDTLDVHKKIVTGSGKRYIVVHTMIFLYKRCCSKTRNTFYSLKKKFFLGLGIYNSAYTHAKFEELNVLLIGQARCLKTATETFFYTIRTY